MKLIYDKLMNKLSNVIENEEARSTHILNNQLYGVGMDDFCTAVSQRRLYGRMDSNKNIKYIKNYSGLVKTGDVNCSEILKGVFGDVRFDVVIGNPPYNNGMDLDFVNIGFEVSNKYVVMIIPAKWQVVNENQRSTSQISYGEFRNKLVSHMSNIVFYPDCRDIFEITEHSGITYFLLDKEKYNDKCIVNNRCDRNRYLRGTTRRDIKNRQSLCNIAAEIAEYIGLDGSNGLKIENMNKQGKYELWSGKFAEYGEVVVGNSGLNSRVKRQFFKDGTTPATTLNMIVRKGIDRCSYSSYRLVFGSNNETEVKSFKSYIDSKLVRFLIFFQVGVPSNILTNDTFRFVPKPPLGKFDRIYTDDEIYKAFKLPNEYIEVIEAVVNDRNKIGEGLGARGMMLFKIPSKDINEKLKWFIYLTNEFGAPFNSIELFIKNFGEEIIGKKFKFNNNMAKEQEKLYLELVEEVDIPYNGGTEFYEIIKNKKFKNTDEIRLFIQNYNVEDWGEDGGMAKYDLDFSITPDLVKRDEVGNEYVEIFMNERNCDCRGRLYEDCTCEIYKGSRVRKVADRILKLGKNNITSLRDKLGIDYSSQELSRDYKIKSVGAFLHLCYGNNGNGWIDLKNANGDMIMIYREVDKHKVTNITDDNKLTRDDFYTDIQHLNIPDKYKDRTFITLEIPGKLTVNYYTDINKDKRIRVTYSNVKDMELKMYSNFEELVFDYVLNYYGISDEFNGLTKRSLNEFKELKSRWRLYGKDIS